MPTDTARASESFWRRAWAPACLVVLVVGVYFTRLTALPICGEETRWAVAAVQMIETGDWIVPRQQGVPFPDRPPMASWLMGLAGLARGQVDLIAIRLPSVLALLATTLLIYAYGRTFLTKLGALAAGAAFATMGQVLEIGRLGENEAVFTLLVSGSLLLWHWGYSHRWPAAAMWASGYTLAALGALQKGPQAPVYFVAVTGVFLIARRDWRQLFTRGHAVGIACFLFVLAAWQIPFYLATDWPTTMEIWVRSASKRFDSGGLIEHMLSYPVETVICLLPWSLMVLGLPFRRVREQLGTLPPHFTFLVTALAVTYPSVWLASSARGRYFMPLYPCIALLVGLAIERCATADAGTFVRKSWERFVMAAAAIAVATGVVFAIAGTVDSAALAKIGQSAAWTLAIVAASLATAYVLTIALRRGQAAVGVLAIAGFVGLVYTGPVVNAKLRTANDMNHSMAQARAAVPRSARLFSFGRVDHRFSYHYGELISHVPWPASAEKLPEDATYFCFNDPPWETDPGAVQSGTQFPFEWEPVAVVDCERRNKGESNRTVVIGRIKADSIRTARRDRARR